MPVEVTCQNCGKTFKVDPNVIKKGMGKYCSKSCYGASRRKPNNCRKCGIQLTDKNWQKSRKLKGEKICRRCKSESEKRHVVICIICNKVFKASSPKVKYCSPKCRGKDWPPTGKNHPRYKEKIKKICENCGKEFKIFPYQAEEGHGIFCSVKCKNKAHQVKRKCKQCGKEFKVKLSKYNTGRGKYCSHECHYLQSNKQVKNCLYCGKEFKIYPSEIKKGNGKYCSVACFNNDFREHPEKHPLWRGGISFEPYCHKFKNEFKERVRDFWKRKCGVCGLSEKENGQKLSVHHVDYNKKSCCQSNKFNSTPNLFIPLCIKHHTKTNHNRKYWEEMLSNYIMIWFNGESYLPKN